MMPQEQGQQQYLQMEMHQSNNFLLSKALFKSVETA
jgi:hypothetical protein